MEPSSFGRKVGMGVRIAGNIARERAAEAARKAEMREAQGPAADLRSPVTLPPEKDLKQRSRNLSEGIGRGTKNFSQSFLGPFAHAGSVLWLEITGCFFALFAVFFAQNLYVLRAQYATGPLHQKFVLYAVITLVFLYFSASSFLRARKKSRGKRSAAK